ncbi:MAG: DUF1028 domain-containing protein [Bdellovibrionales bacterium]|nr:DUF1028 domain-containing protein [Bdellovibrionales bacterium]
MGWGKINVTVLSALFISFALADSARGTIYLAAQDPVTGSIGIAYSSSGGNFWQTRVKGRGLLGEQSYGLCRNATPKAFLEAGDSAETVADKVQAQCDAVGWDQYRLAVVTTDGKIAGLIAKQGCHAGNPDCGMRWGDNFLIIGGGLTDGVLDAGLAAYEKTNPDRPLHCRLLDTLKAVYAAGGEKKDFRGASVTVDDPNLTQLLHWEARGLETTLLPTLIDKIQTGDYKCAP